MFLDNGSTINRILIDNILFLFKFLFIMFKLRFTTLLTYKYFLLFFIISILLNTRPRRSNLF